MSLLLAKIGNSWKSSFIWTLSSNSKFQKDSDFIKAKLLVSSATPSLTGITFSLAHEYAITLAYAPFLQATEPSHPAK